jgi:hypothetical protein
MHSVFHITNRDWLEKLMLKVLEPDAADIKWINTEPIVPSSILSKFACFEPEPVRMIKDPIKIIYKMWGKREFGDSFEPICLVDFDWEKIANEAEEINQRKQVKVIDLSKRYEVVEESDLPF